MTAQQDSFSSRFEKWVLDVKAGIDPASESSIHRDEFFVRTSFCDLLVRDMENSKKIDELCEAAIQKYLEREGARFSGLPSSAMYAATEDFMDSCCVIELNETWPIPGQRLTIDESMELINLLKETYSTYCMKHDGELDPLKWSDLKDKKELFMMLYKASYLLTWQPFKQFVWISIELGEDLRMVMQDFLQTMSEELFEIDPSNSLFIHIVNALSRREEVFRTAFVRLFDDQDMEVNPFFFMSADDQMSLEQLSKEDGNDYVITKDGERCRRLFDQTEEQEGI